MFSVEHHKDVDGVYLAIPFVPPSLLHLANHMSGFAMLLKSINLGNQNMGA